MVALLWSLLACTSASKPSGEAGADTPDPLPAAIRASLDLRGVRPLPVELEAIEEDPSRYAALVDGWLGSATLGDALVTLYAPIFLTQADDLDLDGADYGVPDEEGLLQGMGEEPLRFVAEVAVEDLPLTTLTTADWTVVNDAMAPYYPTDYPDDATGWRKSTWTDGRPSAGLLVSSGLWWRYGSTFANANRGRANALSRILLCNDYLSHLIETSRDLNLLDEDAIHNAIRNDPSCVSCHHSLDPMAAYYWGFYNEFTLSPISILWYHADREYHWRDYDATVPPSYYGVPGEGLAFLGEQIAADPRFPSCFVRQTYERLLQRASSVDDTDALNAHREALLSGGMKIRPLLASIVTSEAYTAAPGTEETPWKVMAPIQYSRSLEALTGYAFTMSGREAMAFDKLGLRSLAGGGRALYGAAAAFSPTPTASLVYERMAQASAASVVASDAAIARGEREGPARLFGAVDFTETLDTAPEVMAAQAVALVWEVQGRRVAADGEEVEALMGLWAAVMASPGANTEVAWAAVLTALLRDPAFLVY